jgi:quercetin dioxygenase-like cupin family protein
MFLVSFVTALLAGCAGSSGDGCPACSGGGAVVTPVAKVTSTAAGQAIRLPEGASQVSACTYDIPPGVKLPVHKHPYPRFAYVMAGDLRVVFADGRSFEYHPGDFIAEAVDIWHYGETLGSVPVRLLVIDATPQGVGNVTPFAPAK